MINQIMRQFTSFVIKETKHILRDKRTMLLLFGMPLLYPAFAVYELIMKVLGPLGIPDILEKLTTM